MALSSKFIKSQINILKPIILSCSLETARQGQDKLGEMMLHGQKKNVEIEERSFENFEGAWVIPYGEPREGVILYLHGGGYTCGKLDYATGFASALAAKLSIRVFAPAYRLAPENKFPAAIDDALASYSYLLKCGYSSDSIILCGESAGGGLCFSLCLRLKEQNLPLPCGIMAISPWTDLTSSGSSYEKNKKKDPSMSIERLRFFSDCYTEKENRKNPLVSPLFGELINLPPTLIFAGGDEIMLSDSEDMHSALIKTGVNSSLHIEEGMWHGYPLFNIKESARAFDKINSFLKSILPYERKLKWLPLDNSAKIYPASRERNTWSNLFRVSVSLKEDIDREILQSSLDVTVRRFPSISVRLRKGMFWYYLEEIPTAPKLSIEQPYPLTRMTEKQLKSCSFRVIAYRNRIAVEFFHALTDGNGGIVFLKTLLAEYIKQKYGVLLPCEGGILDRLESPSPEEFEDSFLKSDGDVSKSRAEPDAFKFRGTQEEDGYLNITTFSIDTKEILDVAHEKKVTLTVLLVSAMLSALASLQEKQCPNRKKQKHIKVLVPVNLRPIFNSKTLRNFVLYITPGIDPKMGKWEFDEICETVHHIMNLQTTKKEMMSRITPNVKSERSVFIKMMPLFIKNFAMKAVFRAVGERKCCITLSNLGRITLPSEAEEFVSRFDFCIGRQSNLPHACGVLSYGGKLYISITRSIKEPDLEYSFFKVLQSLGLNVTVESNSRDSHDKEVD